MASGDDSKLFVAGLPDSISEDVLRQLFESTGGKVLNVSLPKFPDTGRPRGFGFVTLATPEQAQAAREALDGTLQAGRSISVRRFEAEPPKVGPRTPGSDHFQARPPFAGAGGGGAPSGGYVSSGGGGMSNKDRQVYVGNLPFECAQQEIERIFADALGSPGQVAQVSLKRGFAFVTLTSADAAKAAVAALATAQINGRRLRINLAGDKPAGFSGGAGAGGAGPGSGHFAAPRADFAPPLAQPPRRTFDDKKKKPGGTEDGPPKRKTKSTKDDRGDFDYRFRDWDDDDK